MRRLCLVLLAAAAVVAAILNLTAATVLTSKDLDANTCHRPVAGSKVTPPPDLYSLYGVLNVRLEYHTSIDDTGRTLFCFKTPRGAESPTLHVKPGDTLNITLTNMVPALPAGAPSRAMSVESNLACGSPTMTQTSVNMHFHGTNTRPVCHSDEVIHTLVNSSQIFRYSVTFPRDEPPGLYWYHPHVHGIAEAAVQGGATGLIVVEGIENLQPAVARLPQRFLVVRDQLVEAPLNAQVTPPSWDLTLNYVPISYPQLIPAVIEVLPGRKEFWRVANTSADTIVDLQLTYNEVVQPVEVVALDGVATGSQDGKRRGILVTKTDILLPPAARAEFIVTTPPASVSSAVFKSLAIDTGPLGDTDTARTLAVVKTVGSNSPSGSVAAALPTMPEPSAAPGRQRFEGISTAPIAAKRTLYFSEFNFLPSSRRNKAVQPESEATSEFYITVVGQGLELFSPSNPPAIVTTQGSVEEWTIENQTEEVHEFHMHQIHFQLREINHVPVAAEDRQFLDTVQVPYWTGHGPFPSITIAMDFRGDIIGDFVYHCHILGHEDNGMMAINCVLPRK
ncbi:MAG TPA: multicopper oxidase domain-containing protein [Methylocella sp.]|jgi:FtsP/CotA-like multicopper oxidase with cupredoxin domain